MAASAGRTCSQCRAAAAVLRMQSLVVCQSCCLHYVERVFKRQRVVPMNERPLVAFSGGAASASLLDLVLSVRHPDAAHPRHFSMGVVHVFTTDEPPPGLEDFLHSLESPTLRVHCVRLLDDDKRRALAAQSSPVARDDLVGIWRERLLLELCAEHSYDRVLLGTTSTRLAVEVLAATAKGRGAGLAAFVQPVDRGCLVKPLASLNSKEVAYYAFAKKLQTWFTPMHCSMLSARAAGVNGLTTDFVHRLEARTGGTAATVVRAMSKVEPVEGAEPCRLCGRPVTRDPIIDGDEEKQGAGGSGDVCFGCSKFAL